MTIHRAVEALEALTMTAIQNAEVHELQQLVDLTHNWHQLTITERARRDAQTERLSP